MSDEWKSFLHPADEWIVCYASAPASCHSVRFFAAGHALELYLKAVHCKIVGDIKKSMSFGHALEKLWLEIKALDPDFAPSFEVRPTVLAVKALEGGHEKVLSGEDLMHYVMHQELYRVLQHLADLKYLGAPLKSVSGPIAYAFATPEPMWAKLFAEIRMYIGKGHCQDRIALFIEWDEVSPPAAMYLEPIVQAWRT